MGTLSKLDTQLMHAEMLLKQMEKETKKTDSKTETLTSLMTGVLNDASDIQKQLITMKGNLPANLTPQRIQAIINTITTLDRALVEDYIGEIKDAEQWKERALRDFELIKKKLKRGDKAAKSELDKQKS